MELASEALLWLGLIAIIAGFVDAVAGGGGLISVPAMLLFQIPPVNALATNKLQGSFGTATAALTMLLKKRVTFSRPGTMFCFALAGGIAGTILVQLVSADALSVLVPIVLTAIALYFLLVPGLDNAGRSARLKEQQFGSTAVPVIGAYDGFFGPGAGSFYALGGVALRGQNLVDATANAKLLNFASNFASLVVFVIGGKVVWAAGGAMIVGQIIGAWLGSMAVLNVGAKLIRPVIVLACLLMVMRYAEQQGVLNW